MNRDYVGYVLAVVSIIIGGYVSWYYYDKSIQFKRPIFAADYIPQTIYDVKQEFRVPLKVTKEDGSLLTKSVHVATHTFWNAGNLPISTQDVLTPIRISTADTSAELLSVSIAKESRKVVGCTVKPDGPRAFIVSFRILEQDDGCLIRVFYSGGQSIKYAADGDIVGVKTIDLRTETVWDLINQDQKEESFIKSALNYVPRTLLSLAIAILAFLYLREGNMTRSRVIRVSGFLIAVAALVFLADEWRVRSRMLNSPPSANTQSWGTPSVP